MRVLVSYLADARDIKQFIPKLRQWKLSERWIRQLAFNQLHRSVGLSCSHNTGPQYSVYLSHRWLLNSKKTRTFLGVHSGISDHSSPTTLCLYLLYGPSLSSCVL